MASSSLLHDNKTKRADSSLDVYLEWPFSSQHYDPATTNGLRIRHYLDKVIPYGGLDNLDYFEIAEGKATLSKSIDARLVLQGLEFKSVRHRSFLIPIDNNYPQGPHRYSHNYVCLRKELFLELLEKLTIPPNFVDALVDNNGAQVAWTTISTDTGSEIFRDRFDIKKSTSICFIVGSHMSWYQQRLQELFRDLIRSDTWIDPLAVLVAIVSEMSAIYEVERDIRDREIQAEELKTGYTPLGPESTDQPAVIARPDRYATGSTRNLHSIAGQLRFFQRAVDFQICLIEFLIAEHEKLITLKAETMKDSSSEVVALRTSAERIRRSLKFTLSSTRNRHKQSVDLAYRISAQVKIVDNMIAQGDSRANIAIAEQSRKIAIDTKRDSVAMKTIAALTMVFLPATFVATLFGMVFFDINESGDHTVRLSSSWWLFWAITVPLTAVVLILWTGWLKWKMRSTLPQLSAPLDINLEKEESH